MFPIGLCIRRTLSGGVCGLAFLALGASAALAADVDMSTRPDILSGERQVLPVDDVLVAQTFTNAANPYVGRYVELGLTSNLTITVPTIGTELSQNRLATMGTTPRPELVATGRVFNSSTDVGITFTLSDYPTAAHLETTLLTKSGTALSELGTQTIPMTAVQPKGLAVADFTGDGFGDVAFFAITSSTAGGIVIGTAADVDNPGAGLRFGPVSAVRPCVEVKAADLDGDGAPEIVCLYHDTSSLYVRVYAVDPATLQLIELPGNEYRVASWASSDRVRLAVGKFDDDIRDAEIAVVQAHWTNADWTPELYVRPIKVSIAPATDQVTFVAAPAVDIGPSIDSTTLAWNKLTALEVATGRLDWFGGNARDQLVIGAGLYMYLGYEGYTVAVVDIASTATNTMSVTPAQVRTSAFNQQAAPYSCLAGVAIGRFSPPAPTSTSAPPTNSQVAVLIGNVNAPVTGTTQCSGPDVWSTARYDRIAVEIYTVDPANKYKLAWRSTRELADGGNQPGGSTGTPPRMAVGDFQGRSLLLGKPSIITVAQQTQAQFVIGAPPMHIDYFTPQQKDPRPECFAPDAKVVDAEPTSIATPGVTASGCIQNVSAYPGIAVGANGSICEYCAKFVMSNDKVASGTQSSVTSHTWANGGGGSATITFGTMKPSVFGGGGMQAELHGSAKRMHSTADTTVGSVTSSNPLTLTTLTDADDLVWYTTQDVYIYLYPVIGRTDDQGKPVYLQFSIPDKTQTLHDKGRNLPWFQPAHEVGNIFSYPGNEQQLLAEYPGAKKQAGPFNWTSAVADTVSLSWQQGLTEGKTSASVDRTEWNTGGSVTGVVGASGILVAKANAYYDHNESRSNEDTNHNAKSLSNSVGFFITSQSFEKVPSSSYSMTALFLGSSDLTLADGFWDDEVPLPSPTGTPGELFVPNFQLAGPIRLVYATDMVSNTIHLPGTLWGDVYKTPDIALQHSNRYQWVQKTSTVSQSDLWHFYPLYSRYDLSSVYQSEFLRMKGFFITSANATAVEGPQMTMATEGIPVRLWARVYNYSVKELPANATVKVRFYVHQLHPDTESYAQAWVPGACTLIGEDTVSLGKFDVTASTPQNRALATTLFDTTGRGGQRLMFWVVAWAENADGTLVPEVEQHGLTQKPPAGCPAKSILDMPIEFYSNNVGFYPQPFYIMPTLLAATPRAAAAAAPVEDFSIASLSVSPIELQRPYAGEQWELVAALHAGGADALSVNLVHQGSGPGGSVSLTSSIPYIEAGQTYVDRVPFRPLWCGPHNANVTARPAFHDPVSKPLTFDIPCRPQDVTAFMNDVITDGSLAGVIPLNPNGKVVGKLAAIQTAVLKAEELAGKGAITGACEQYAQALARISNAGSGPTAQLFGDIVVSARRQLGCR